MISIAGIHPQIGALIQQGALERVFGDALFPSLLFRQEAQPEKWAANLGETMTFTRTGLMPVDERPLNPGSDPIPTSYPTEQYTAVASQYGNSIDTHMPTSYVSIQSKFLRDTHALGLNAGETLNRIIRNRLYRAYLGGNTAVILAAAAGVTQIRVASINGFTEGLAGGLLQGVGAGNPMPVTFSGGEPANTVVGAVPLVATDPYGPGVLTLGAPLTTGLALRAAVLSASRARIIRVGGGDSVDAIGPTDTLTMADLIAAVTRMRAAKIPPKGDGYYHVHLTPEGEAQLFADPVFQRLNAGLPDGAPYRDFAVGQLLGCRIYRNTETPNTQNVGVLRDTSGGAGSAAASPLIGAEVMNQTGVQVGRAIVVGGAAIYEKFIDESEFVTDAGVSGKIGNFTMVNGGVAVNTERIRYILRAPQDRLQQVVSQSWSWSGDFPIPSDGLSGDGARFKRAVVIEHAS